ncbi:vWA domain-containing protein [Amycolatopsis sp. NPDC005961]|uniref:vWA domain-containing protein n=1 Tax=Amycolatopsis sp. NPDC005961 TaxID=3156720 RepID=UPI0033D7165B
MPDPTIDPTTGGAAAYTMSDTSAFVTVFSVALQAGGGSQESFTLQYAETVTGVTSSLTHIDTGTGARITQQLPANGTLFVPPTGTHQYQIDVVTETVQGDTVNVGVTFTDLNGGVVDGELWELRVSAGAPADWSLGFSSDNVKVQWAAVNPVATLNVPATAVELQNLDLHAGNAMPATTFAGTPPGFTAKYDWSYTGAAPITAISNNPTEPTETDGTTLTVNLPSVYEQVPIQFGLNVKLTDTAGLYTGFLHNSTTAPTTITQRRKDIVFVLDRSGSMALENRFENAKIASRVLVHLINGLLTGVGTDDRVAIVAFEDEVAGFRAGPPSSRIVALLPLTPLDDALKAINNPAFDFGAPGTNTPIGDGLIFAIDLLGNAGPITDQRFSIIMFTDGQENGGHVALVPASATPANGAISFHDAVNSSSLRQAVLDPKRCSLSAIALGPSADQNVLSKLSEFNGGVFALANDPSELTQHVGDILADVQKVNAVTKATTPTTGVADPDAPPAPAVLPAVYFSTEPSVDRLVLAVTPKAGTTVFTDTIQLSRWDGASFQPFPVEIQETQSDRALSVAQLPAVAKGKKIDWRLIHGTGPSTAEELDPSQVLVYLDLHLLADVVLDKPSYLTGDRMVLTVRVRQDDQPIRGATVTATLDAPTVGLGQQLTALTGAASSSVAGSPDKPTWMEQRIGALLTKQQWKTLPRTCHGGSGLFVDGTNGLFDPDGDGNYTNTFAKVFKEGTYVWHLSVAGTDLNGNPFTRELTITTFVRVKVDPKATKITVTRIAHDPSGMLAAQVVVLPQDKRGEDLGPGKDDEVIFALRDGAFQHVVNHQPAPVQTDGTYQRVILFTNRQRPTLKVSAAGVLLPTIDIRRRLLGFEDDD